MSELLDTLSPSIRRHVGAGSPMPLRLMAAKGVLPSTPIDFAIVLFLLKADVVAEVREAAQVSARNIPEKLMHSIGDGVLPTEVVDWLLELHGGNADYAKLLMKHASQEAIARCASHCASHCAEPQEADTLTAEQLAKEFASIEDEKAAPLEEEKKRTLSQAVARMSVSEKIKLAMRGNKEIRTLLLRDTNRLVAVAALESPRITEAEILSLAQNRTTPEEILRIIFRSKEWLKRYPIRLALTKNAKVPAGISIRLLSTLRENDIKNLAKDRNIPNAIQTMAKKLAAPKKD